MKCAIGTFDGHVPVALPEGRFPIGTGSPLGFARAHPGSSAYEKRAHSPAR